MRNLSGWVTLTSHLHTQMNTQLKERNWTTLLKYVESRKVIPVVGDAIHFTDTNGETLPLKQLLAQRLATYQQEDLLSGEELRSYAGRYIESFARPLELYADLNVALDAAPLTPPLIYEQLASITDFPLFITLSVDDSLARTIAKLRGKVEQRCFTPEWRNDLDLPEPVEKLATTTVYYLFGKSSTEADHVITDESLLEFLSAMQQETRRPRYLFGALKSYHLLLLGCDLPDWAMRLWLRSIRGETLSRRMDHAEYHVTSKQDEQLYTFLRQYSKTTTFITNQPEEFTTELLQRWQDRQTEAIITSTDTINTIMPNSNECDGKIFISYASQDQDIVKKLCRQLNERGIDAWFDVNRLDSGDLYTRKIRDAIENCSFFMPIISANTEERLEGFFRREWRIACDRLQGMHHSRVFLLPVAIGNMTPYKAKYIEDIFNDVQWICAPDGIFDARSIEHLIHLMKEFRRAQGV